MTIGGGLNETGGLRVSMTAKIIRLEQFNVGCRHPANGVRFPLVYRVTGFEFDLGEGSGPRPQFLPGTTPVAPFYTLSDDSDFGIANPSFHPLKVLDAGKDKGRVVVRHHTNRARGSLYRWHWRSAAPCLSQLRPNALGNGGWHFHNSRSPRRPSG
jgi:hypothetical protein